MICSFCKATLNEETCFCIYCGKDLRNTSASSVQAKSPFTSFSFEQANASATCPHCKSPLRSGASFCSACGKSPLSSPSSLPKEKETHDMSSVFQDEKDGQSQKAVSSTAVLSEVPIEKSSCADFPSSEEAEAVSSTIPAVSTAKKSFSIRSFFSSTSEQKTITLHTKNVFTATGAFALLLIVVMIGGFLLGGYSSPENRFIRALEAKDYARAASIYLEHSDSPNFNATSKIFLTPEAAEGLAQYNIVFE